MRLIGLLICMVTSLSVLADIFVPEGLIPNYPAGYEREIMVDGIQYALDPVEKVAVVTDDNVMLYYADCDISLLYPLIYHGDVVIPEEVVYGGETYTVIGVDAFRFTQNIDSIDFPGTLKYVIGFETPHIMSHIAIPEGTEMVMGFVNTCFEEIQLPSSIKTFGQYFGMDNPQLKSFAMPAGVGELPEEKDKEATFMARCESLETLDLGDRIKVVTKHSFSYLGQIRFLSVPESVEEIHDNSFCYCPMLEEIVLPSHPVRIGASFRNLTALRRVTVLSQEAFDIDPDSFGNVNFDECELVVPVGCGEAYAGMPGWKRFRIIETGQNEVGSFSSDCGTERYYDLNGRQIVNPAKGETVIRIREGGGSGVVRL